MKEKELDKHVFTFNRGDNGGEQLLLVTTAYDNGNGEIFFNQELTLYSYCNSASFNLVGAQIGSQILRKLADELENFEKDCHIKILAGI